MTAVIDGHVIEPLPNGACYVTTDGKRTLHHDQDAAVRHIARISGERGVYEAKRIMQPVAAA